jgi:hypothetical protein
VWPYLIVFHCQSFTWRLHSSRMWCSVVWRKLTTFRRIMLSPYMHIWCRAPYGRNLINYCENVASQTAQLHLLPYGKAIVIWRIHHTAETQLSTERKQAKKECGLSEDKPGAGINWVTTWYSVVCLKATLKYSVKTGTPLAENLWTASKCYKLEQVMRRAGNLMQEVDSGIREAGE